MRNITKYKYITNVYSLLFVLLFTFCIQVHDNPISPDYNGDYVLSVTPTNLPQNDTLEIFKKYSISVKNKSSDKYWHIFVGASKPGIVNCIDSVMYKDSGIINFFLTEEPYNGPLYIIGERPNRQKDTTKVINNSIIARNPYFISGDTLVGIGKDSLFLKSTAPNTSDFDTIYWIITNGTKKDTTKVKATSYPQCIANVSKGNDTISAIIKEGSSEYKLPPFVVRVPGHTPEIVGFESNTLNLDSQALFNISCNDSDGDSLRMCVLGNKDTLLDTTLSSNQKYHLHSRIIKDTTYSSLNLIVSDSTKLSVSTSISSKTAYITPEINLKDSNDRNITIDINSNTPPIIHIEKTNSDSLYWTYYLSKDTSKTTSDEIPLKSYRETTTDTLFIWGIKHYDFDDKTIRIPSKKITVIITPKQTKYTIHINSLPDTILTNTSYSFNISVFDNSLKLPIQNSLVTYKWEIPPKDTLDFISIDSNVTFNLKDSISSKYFSVKAIIHNQTDTTTFDTSERLYPIQHIKSKRPSFRFLQKPIADTKLNIQIPFTANDSANPGKSVEMIFYQIPELNITDSIPFNTTSKIIQKTFPDSGTFKIIGWARDNESILSNKDTAILIIKFKSPVLVNPSPDTIRVTLNDSIPLIAKVNGPLDSITKFKWDTTGDSIYDSETKTNTFMFHAKLEGTFAYSVTCETVSGDTTVTPITFHIIVTKHQPKIDVLPDNVNSYINSSSTFKIKAYDTVSSISKVKFYQRVSPADSVELKTFDTTNGYSIEEQFTTNMYQSTGKFIYYAIVYDKNGNETKTSDISIIVDSGVPKIDQFTIFNSDSIHYINDSIKFFIKASDPNNSINSIIVYSTNNGTQKAIDTITPFKDTITGSFSIPESGTFSISAVAIDATNFRSSPNAIPITIDAGLPKVNSINLSPLPIYRNKKVTFAIHAQDNDQMSLKYTHSFDSTSFSEYSDSASFDTTFNTPGVYTIYVRVHDTDNNVKNSSVKFTVLDDMPYIEKINVIGTIYVSDTAKFNAVVGDPNGSVQKLIINWNGDTTLRPDTINVTDTFVSLLHKFSRADTALKTIFLRAVDNEGNISNWYPYTVNVHKAPPTINTKVDSVWVNDIFTINLHSLDSASGSILNRWVDWDNNGTWDESSTTKDYFTHSWDISFGGKTATYTIKVMDNDSFYTIKQCSTFVKMGRPVIKGGATYGITSIQWKADTMFYIYTGGSSTIAVDTADTNGVIKEFYWDSYRDGRDITTTVPIWTTTLPPNVATPFTVSGRDDDSIISNPYNFYVYPDAPPPIPTNFFPAVDGDSIVLRWEKTIDIKDGGNTKVQIYICFNPNTIPTTPLFNTPITVDSLRTYTTGGGTLCNYYKFKPDTSNANKDGKWKVVLIDERNSKSESTIQSFQAPGASASP